MKSRAKVLHSPPPGDASRLDSRADRLFEVGFQAGFGSERSDPESYSDQGEDWPAGHPRRGHRALAFDTTFGEYLAGQPTRDTGTFEGDLLSTARDWMWGVKRLAWGRTLRGVVAEVQQDPSLADAGRERFVVRICRERLPIIERAIERGGPMYHRYLNGHLPLSDAFARGLARMVPWDGVTRKPKRRARAAGARLRPTQGALESLDFVAVLFELQPALHFLVGSGPLSST